MRAQRDVYYLSTSYNENRPKLYVYIENSTPIQEFMKVLVEQLGVELEDIENWSHFCYSETILGTTAFLDKNEAEKINAANNERNKDDPDFFTQVETVRLALVMDDSTPNRYRIVRILID